MLSHPLPVIALVSRYLTNKLIGPRLIPERLATLPYIPKDTGTIENYPVFQRAMLYSGVDTKVLLTRSPLSDFLHRSEESQTVRLVCLIHTASVHPGPGSNPR